VSRKVCKRFAGDKTQNLLNERQMRKVSQKDIRKENTQIQQTSVQEEREWRNLCN
jgi:hypothetical protein